MTNTMFNVEAEEACLGAAMLYRAAAEVVVKTLTSSEFSTPARASIHAGIAELYRAGKATDSLSVHAELVRAGAAEGISVGDLIALTANAPGPSSTATHAAIVADFAFRRRAVAEATAFGKDLADPTRDPGEALEAHRARLTNLDSPLLARSPGDVEIDDFIDDPGPGDAEVVIPGLLTVEDRAIVVAGEGIGKSELMRQIVVTASYGLHPFLFSPIPPVPALLVDLENSRSLLRHRLGVLGRLARQRTKGDRAPGSMWSRPGGIDLRRRLDRLELESVLQRRRPRLVVLGPVYKCYARKSTETEEQVASEVQAVFDDFRTRYAFALVLEHHAPQGTAGGRELRPYGSSLWLRWPEFGISLRQDADHPRDVLHLERWRGDRVRARWPESLHRGREWPWEGRWDEEPW